MEVLSLIIGGAIGFISAIGKDWLLENKKQQIKKQEFQRAKLEEIFVLMDITFRSSIVPIEMTGSNVEYNGAKLSMLIRFYFSNLEEEYKKYINLFQKINMLKIENFMNKTNNLDEQLLNEFTSQYQTFLSCLVTESKKLKV